MKAAFVQSIVRRQIEQSPWQLGEYVGMIGQQMTLFFRQINNSVKIFSSVEIAGTGIDGCPFGTSHSAEIIIAMNRPLKKRW